MNYDLSRFDLILPCEYGEGNKSRHHFAHTNYSFFNFQQCELSEMTKHFDANFCIIFEFSIFELLSRFFEYYVNGVEYVWNREEHVCGWNYVCTSKRKFETEMNVEFKLNHSIDCPLTLITIVQSWYVRIFLSLSVNLW